MEPAGPIIFSAQDVGNKFVKQYYTILFGEPKLGYRFYEDSSVLSWPGPNGEMTSATTIQGIKDLILSLDLEGYKAEIKTVDAQDSYKEGVLVLVTGCLSGEGDVDKTFAQTFFLAPQAKGYYILNDVFRFVDVPRAVTPPSPVNDANEDVASTPLSPNQESAHVPNQAGQNHSTPTKDTSDGSSDKMTSNDSNSPVVKEVVVSEQLVSSSKSDGDTAAKTTSDGQENAKKISYASMVAKESTVTSPSQSTTTVVVARSSTHQQQWAPAPPKASSPASNGTAQNTRTDAQVKSIYVGNLPSDVSITQLEAVFKKFGAIRKGGIQVRNFKDGFCYGFVEFESSKSASSAIEVHNIMVGSKEAYITVKKSTNQAGNGRGRFSSEKCEFKNDGYGNRQNFEGRRYQNGNQSDFSGQARGPTRSNGEAHQKGYENGGGKIAHSSGTK